MYEIVKNIVSFIHLFMMLMITWIFEFSQEVYSTDYRVWSRMFLVLNGGQVRLGLGWIKRFANRDGVGEELEVASDVWQDNVAMLGATNELLS
jgi:hypothetical protein